MPKIERWNLTMVNNRTLGFDIVVNTQGSDGKITSIKQDINALQAAIEKVSKDSSLTLNIDGFKRNLEEARALQNKFIAQLDQLNNSRIDVANRAANAEAEAARKQQEYISNLKATQNANANKQWWDDQDAARKARTEQLKAQMGANVPKYSSYASELQALQRQAEILHREYIQGGKVMTDYKSKMKELETQAKQVKIAMETMPNLNNVKTTSALGSWEQKATSHARWIATGAAIGAAVAVPAEVLDSLRETEVLTLKIKQNLELAPQYHGNESGLNTDVKHLQDVAATFAMGYGTSLKESLEMMQVLSRRFKSPEELTYYTNLAMIMHKLDFVEPKKAAEDLEAAILSMGLNFEESRKFIDQFSVAVHVARITGTELLTGLQRTGAVFKNMNFNTAEAIAMISTLSTVTAKAGANVGAAISSILVNVDFKKATQALKAYSVEVYDSTGKMRDGVEIWREIAGVFNGLDDQKANEFANAISGGKYRANDLRALVSNWQTFEQILKEINEQASPENTAKLLQTGLSSLDTELQRLTASLQVLGISLSEQALPALKDMVIGLAQGVQWLNNHKEAAGNVISVLKTLVELLIVYKTHQILANSAVGEFVKNMWLEIRTAPSVSAAIAGMGSAFMGLARTIGMACIQLAAFQALARVISGASADTDEKAFLASIEGKEDLTPMEQEAKAAIDNRNAFIDENALLNGDNDYTGKWALYGSQTSQNESTRLDNIVRSKVGAVNGMNDINTMVEEATKAIAAKGAAVGTEYSSVPGQDITPPRGGSHGGGLSGADAPDNTEKRKRIELQSHLDKMFSDMKVSADVYSTALEKLNDKESILGKTVDLNNQKYDLMTQRIQEMALEQAGLIAERERYQAQIDEYMEKDKEFQETINGLKPEFSSMDKKDRREFILQNKEGMDDFKTLKKLLDLLNKTNEKIAETDKNANKLIGTFDKEWLGNTQNVDKQYERRLKNIDTDTQGQKAHIGYFDSFGSQKEAQVELEQTIKKIKEMEDRLKYLQSEYKKATSPAKKEELSDEIQGLKVKVDEAAKSLDKLKDKFSDVKRFWADSFVDMANNTKTLGDVGKEIFRQLQKDAIYSLMGIKHEASAASQMFQGLGKGGAKTGKGGKGSKPSDGFAWPTFGTGGVATTPSIVGENYQEEVVIPTEGDTRKSPALLEYASKRLGTDVTAKGGTYVPTFNNQELANKPVVNVSVQKDNESIRVLQDQLTQMKEQTSLLMNHLGNSGNTTVIATQVSSDQVLQILQQNPAALQNILGRQKSAGWR
ncbi:MAG: phage tail tape measure protein [Bacilli bacterium]|nr:phage tail tape measure protein [Bacilli bacterium]